MEVHTGSQDMEFRAKKFSKIKKAKRAALFPKSFSFISRGPSVASESTTSSPEKPEATSHAINNEIVIDEMNSDDDIHSNDDATLSLSNPSAHTTQTAHTTHPSLPDTLIKDSYAALLGSGRKITVNSVATGVTYNFDQHSEHCVVGLSISDKLEFNEDVDVNDGDQLATAKKLLEDIIKNHSKLLLEKIKQVYESKECGICMDGKADGRPIDSVFYQCGHQCCHYDCAKKIESKKCPICRNHISAFIKL